MIWGGTLKDGYAENGPSGPATGVSWWQMARSLAWMYFRWPSRSGTKSSPGLPAGGVLTGLLPELAVDQHVAGHKNRRAAQGGTCRSGPRRGCRGWCGAGRRRWIWLACRGSGAGPGVGPGGRFRGVLLGHQAAACKRRCQHGGDNAAPIRTAAGPILFPIRASLGLEFPEDAHLLH